MSKENINKGFTLIELLAIIVILAIIAVITVPIILNIIENTKKGATEVSAHGYKKAIQNYILEQETTNSEQLKGTYTTDELKTRGLMVSGKTPNKGLIRIDEKEIYGCLVYEEYEVIIGKNEIIETKKGNCKGNFKDDSWETMTTKLKLDRTIYDEELGKEKIIEMDVDGNSENEKYLLRLANTSPCSESTAISKTSCGVVVEFLTVVGTHKMNSTCTNAGGWASSLMRTYINAEIYNLLPSDLQNVIISTYPIVSASGNDGNDSPNIDAPGDKLYLLSIKEISSTTEVETNTNTLDFYNVNASNNTRKKYLDINKMSTIQYWLRSAVPNRTDWFFSVRVSGDKNINANGANYDSNGVAPAFRIYD